MGHLKRNRWIYLSLTAFLAVVYFFSLYAMAYGESGIQGYIFDHHAFITAEEITLGLSRLGEEGVSYYSKMYTSGLDFLYPLTFTIFSFLLIAKAAGTSTPWKLVLVAPPILFLADAVENITILSILNASPEPVSGYDYLGYIIAFKTAAKWAVYSLVIISLSVLATQIFNKSSKRDAEKLGAPS